METKAQYAAASAIYPLNSHLTRHENWTVPPSNLVRQMLSKSGFSQSQFALTIGVKDREVRRWVAGDVPIPYLAWAILCDYCGESGIWRR